jgi:hypothetical protein
MDDGVIQINKDKPASGPVIRLHENDNVLIARGDIAIGTKLAPPNTQSHHHARLSAGGDLSLAFVAAAVVENPHHHPVFDLPCCRVIWVDFQERFTLHVAQAFHIHKAGI